MSDGLEISLVDISRQLGERPRLVASGYWESPEFASRQARTLVAGAGDDARL
jgi:hypothetical protein